MTNQIFTDYWYLWRIITRCACCKKCTGDKEPDGSVELGNPNKNGTDNIGYQHNENIA